MAKQPAEVAGVREPSSTLPSTFGSPSHRGKRNRLRPLLGVSRGLAGLSQPSSTAFTPCWGSFNAVVVVMVGFQVPGGGQRILHAQNPNNPCSFAEFLTPRRFRVGFTRVDHAQSEDLRWFARVTHRARKNVSIASFSILSLSSSYLTR